MPKREPNSPMKGWKKMNLGEKIKKVRLELKLTQQEVAGDFISRHMLSKIESGAANPSLKTLEYLAQKLNKPISFFLSEDGKEYLNDDSKAAFEHASFLIKSKEYDKCITYLKQMFKTITEDPEDKYYGYLLYLLAKCHIMLDDYSHIRHFLDSAIEILERNKESNKDNFYLADMYYCKSSILFYDYSYEDALGYMLKAIDEFHNSYVIDRLFEIKLYFTYGFTLFKLNNYKDAFEVLNKVLEISRESKCYYSLGDTYMLLGVIYYDKNELDAAIYYTKKAIQFFDCVEELDNKAACEKNVGNYYLYMGDFQRAKSYLNRSLEYFHRAGDYIRVNTIKSDLQELLVKQGSFTKAIACFKEIDLEVLGKVDRARVFMNMGNAYVGIGDYKRGQEYLMKAEELLKDSNRYDILHLIYDSISSMYSKLSNFEQAYIYSEKSKGILKLVLKD